jgi:uncharacterized repeat protein (TIGR03803 family)
MSKLNWGMRACAIFLLWAMAAIALPAQTFTTLHSFDLTDGQYPEAGMIQGTDGNLYGTTQYGEANIRGNIFKISTSGTLKSLYSFCPQGYRHCTDGSVPYAGLVQGTDGNFYGTTEEGGTSGHCGSGIGCGTIFKINPGGTLTTLHSFDYTDGDYPRGGLIQGTDGNFYGTTTDGGANHCGGLGSGTVFTITPSGMLTTLYSFGAQDNCPDGAYAQAGLVQGADGNFYGTTSDGGVYRCGGIHCGTIFKITPSGTLTTLHSFDYTDGYFPVAGLVQDADGNFYGTTAWGGNSSCPNGCGTIFKITPCGTLTTQHSFNGTDGAYPDAALVRGTDGNFYGTTVGGGAGSLCNGGEGCGTVFKFTPRGVLTNLHSFCLQTGCPDGDYPTAQLVQYTNGNFYGTTRSGGNAACAGGCGTVFSISVGLGPFVETQPTSGEVGKTIKILGTNLTGATSVTFNGTAAAFTVKSKSEITTTVPLGATTGKVRVTFQHGTRSSNVPFRVR